jgi:hypothetical protein
VFRLTIESPSRFEFYGFSFEEPSKTDRVQAWR